MKIPEFDDALWAPSEFLEKKFKRRFWRRFFATIGPHFTLKTIDGIQSIVDLRDLQGVSKVILKDDRYEDYARKLALKWIRPDSNVIDIGANIGFWSVFCAKQTTGTVYAFEPDAANLRLLEANLKINHIKNVKVSNKACANEKSVLKLYLSPSNFGDHQLFDSGESRKSVNIDVCRIDDEIGVLDNVSFVKIDVQGFEEMALRGLEKNLVANRDVTVFCEFWPDGMRKAGSDPDRFLDWMASLGFKMKTIPHLQEKMLDLPRNEIYKLCANGAYVDLIFQR